MNCTNCKRLEGLLAEAIERRQSAKRCLRETLEARGVKIPASYGFADILTLYARAYDRLRGADGK